MRAALFACLLLAALSTLLAAAPGYDAWAWLTWGREIAHLNLSTEAGPAFKPLPVAVCALLAPLGDHAPTGWVIVARAGALAAVVLAARLASEAVAGRGGRRSDVVEGRGRRRSDVVEGRGRRRGEAVEGRVGSRAAALVAALGVLLTGGFVRHAAAGDTEPLLVAFALAAALRHGAGRPGQALALGAAAALLRPETWPFLALYALWVGREHRGLRPAIAALAVLLPAAWFLPELAGSGQLLRSSDRALVPNPGAPALAERPALESLWRALGLLPLPLAAAAIAARSRAALLPALAGVAWCVLVALMAEAGFSGEERYMLPGVALVSVTAGVGAARLGRAAWVGRAAGLGRAAPAGRAAAVLVAGALAAPTLLLGARELADLGPRLADHAELVADLPAAIARAGGRDALLACGRPAVGRFRGTMLAWHLGVHKERVRADGEPAAVTFRSRRAPGTPVTPAAPPGARLLAAAGRWRIEATCGRPQRSVARRSTSRTSSTTGSRPTATMHSAGNAAVS